MDSFGQFGMPVGVFLHGRALAAAIAGDEFLGQDVDGVPLRRSRSRLVAP